MKKLSGVCPPVITIFDHDGKIDYEANEKLADYLIEKGVDGLTYLGTSGEFSVLTLSEKKEFIKKMTAYVNKRVQVISGIGSTSLKDTIELLACVEEADVDGCLLINPFFSVYEESMVEAYYADVAARTQLPILIYNFPALTGFDFSPEFVKHLAGKYKNIVGIKDTVENAGHLYEMLKVRKVNPDFSVFCAYESQAMGSLFNGIDGMINATANFAPEFTVGLFHSFKQGDYSTATKHFNNMCEAMEMYQYSSPLFLACKQAVYTRIIGNDGGERLPAVALKDETKAKISNKLYELGLINKEERK